MVSKVGFASQILTFSKRSSRCIIRVSNSLDPDQDRHYNKSVILLVLVKSKGFAKVSTDNMKRVPYVVCENQSSSNPKTYS